jgi:Anti-sigma regulatory factor (Ser/Thr protein kinase)
MITTDRELACEPEAAGQARRWTRRILQPRLPASDASIELVEDIVLCVSELVSNAYQAGCRHMRLRCTITQQAIRVSLADDAPGQPRFGPLSDPSQPRGRGLHLVSTLAQRCTVTSDPRGPGKQVWIEFGRPGHASIPGAETR